MEQGVVDKKGKLWLNFEAIHGGESASTKRRVRGWFEGSFFRSEFRFVKFQRDLSRALVKHGLDLVEAALEKGSWRFFSGVYGGNLPSSRRRRLSGGAAVMWEGLGFCGVEDKKLGLIVRTCQERRRS
ncbi:hypothetical protein COLO4_38419 [Corchorus olitorius]|uniref:Uncharacterized protein n=1 Tax=Corchorus olitorius TaxID=93759 RepID=A0A1R3FVE9_9ROSI|nr:hypothetical protein COLO4_38419 [Corchorus olitorius]